MGFLFQTEFLRVLCGLPTDNPISYIPALVQLQKQPGGKPQKLENILNETIQQFEDGKWRQCGDGFWAVTNLKWFHYSAID